MNPITRILFCLALLAALAGSAWAQPANDSFVEAWLLPGASVSTNGNNTGATKEGGEPAHAGFGGSRSVWFNWTAPTNGLTRIDTLGSSFDTLLGVYTGNSVSGLTLVASNDNGEGGSNGSSLVQFNAVAGTTYRIAIDNRRNFFFGNYVLNLRLLASIIITSPSNGTVVAAGSTFPVTVTASVPTPPVRRVDLFRGSTLLGSLTNAPYQFTVSASVSGTNALYAVAVDGAGLSWTSSVVNVAVLNQGLTITAPSQGDTFFNTNALTISAVGLLPSGSITNVSFFVDGVLVGVDPMVPFSIVWTSVTPGLHQLTAVGRGTDGQTYNSTPVMISVARTLIPLGSVWKYLDNGTDQDTAWQALGFNDSTWASGPAELGYGDGDEVTVVGFGPDPNNRHITTYFRHSFAVTGALSYTNLQINIRRDDGAVVYLNGVELGRFNVPAGPVDYRTPVPNAQDDGNTVFTATVPASALREGTNVIAVEIHQTDVTSSDISFEMSLVGIQAVPRNLLPIVALTSPTNNAAFFAPTTITLSANASDPDGSVARVEFFVDGARLGQSTNAPYSLTWSNITQGAHLLKAVATDDQGATQNSTEIQVVVYDAGGTPMVRITQPTEGAVFEGPTNLTVSAEANAPGGVNNVQFIANGTLLGTDTTFPYSLVWTNATFGTNRLSAIITPLQGNRTTSSIVTIVVNAPPPNLAAPTVATVLPAPGSSVTNLSTIQVIFSEVVVGVDAADLLVNGVPATSISGSGSNYIFTVGQPAYGVVNITWATNHGIEDIGYPPLAFNATAPSARWTYNFLDAVPPTIVARNPAANAIVTNLTQVGVTFSENVSGVDAADFLVNGSPAIGVSGSGSNYVFSFSQPGAGTVNISWVNNHGIGDLASPANPFNRTGPGATWSYTLDARTILVQSNANWLFIKGTAEASTPIDAWRSITFNDSSWSNAPAPFFYGDPYGTPAYPGTTLSDMQGSYASIYLRSTFNVLNAALVTNLFLVAQSDDGFIAWINGVEVVRFNMPSGEVPYNGNASTATPEPQNAGSAYISYTLPEVAGLLREGTNVLAVHAFNQSLGGSSDFGFNAQLYTFLADPGLVPPRLVSVIPAAGNVFSMTNITVQFSEPVTGVDAADLLINGVPATSIVALDAANYRFVFAQPAFGNVQVRWATNHGIRDLDTVPKNFDATGSGATFSYTFLNTNAPIVVSQNPPAGATVSNLTSATVTFSKTVVGVDASDLLVNGTPATSVSGSGATYTFTFPASPFGIVSLTWAAAHGIRDTASPANDFDPSRPGGTWSYTEADLVPPVIASLSPPAGSVVTNFTRVTVTFSEPVSGVDAGDLRLNGVSAMSVSNFGASYTFQFAQANATTLVFTWAANHGIADLAATPNAFDASASGTSWSYTTPDTVPPTVVTISPPPFVTVRSLSSIKVTFSEPVVGVSTNSLLVNNQPVRQVSGSGAGPYTFAFLPPSNGVVDVRWVNSSGITDLATPPNPFAGGEWNYRLDPTAVFANAVLINEIMLNPASGRGVEEWIELRNVTTNLVNLAGWYFTRGVKFVFPNVSIPAGGYLVVAADLPTFRASFPAVTNVVGGWTGSLANTDETLELATALDEVVNTVHYATQGDWARRERGNGAERVVSITRNGGTATITVFDHGLTGTDQITISGADQPEYNGRFTVSGITAATFNITVSGAPATPATGAIIMRSVLDNGFSGWTWFSAADGYGASLELINPGLPNSAGQNWAPSLQVNGTPGRANGNAANNIAPLILNVTHFPAVPRSTEPVTVNARILDELPNGVQNVTLYYRSHSTRPPPAFSNIPMWDDGAHGDGVLGDGLFGASLPAMANGTVLEFYVQASDTTGLIRTWPAPSLDTNGVTGQFANALYQVDNEVITNTMPSIRLVMTDTERAIFPPSDRNSDAAMNATLISVDGDGTKIRHGASVRVRGAGTRSRTPPSNRINIPNDNRWNGLRAINLNSQFVHAQLVGNTLSQKAGVPATDAHVIQYRINGVNPAPSTTPSGNNGAGYGTFVLMEPVNGDFAQDRYPEDGDGNVYRASTGNHNADLTYQGTNPSSYLARGYFKTSNQTENDWTDLFNLTFAFSQVPADADYVTAISTNVNVSEWMRYFAVGTLLSSGETALFNGRGDDYALYRGVTDPRFVVIGHDFDTILGQGDTGANYYPVNTNSSIFTMINPPNPNANVPALRRFMTNAAFAPVYYAELLELANTVFAPSQLNPLLDQLLTGWGNGPSATTIQDMKNYANNRRTVALSQIPLGLTVTHSLSLSNGYLTSTSPSVSLSGVANAVRTRRVLLNGTPANWSAWEARWTGNYTLQPGINRILVQSLDSNNVAFASSTLDVWFNSGTPGQTVAGTVASDTTWSAATGPYNVTGSIIVASGATLTIQPGTTLYLGSGVNITVANGGRLLAEGTETAPIRFIRAPGVTTTWGGITINGGPTSPETRIRYAHFEFNNSTAIHSADGTLFLDHLTFGTTTRQYVSLDRSSFVVQDCVFPTGTAAFELVHGAGGIKAGGRGIFLRNFFGTTIGYNDVVDFTGGNRPGPIVEFINNVFMGASDDILDLDSADSWIERNIFLHSHKNGSPDSSSAISGGADNADTSQITIIGNIIFDVDNAANAKQGNFYSFINNTIVRQTWVGGTDTNGAVALLSDVGTVEGAGMYLEGNIVQDARKLVAGQTAAFVTYTNNILSLPWNGPGGNNRTNDALLKYVPTLTESSNFNSWAEAQIFWEWFSLQAGSPARGAGPNGRDLGGVIPIGVSISGEPRGTTSVNNATLYVGVNRTGNGLPVAGFPNGTGYTHYRWRLDGGPWSAETSINTPITLVNLPAGPHQVEVVGKRDSGSYQNDPVYGPDAVTSSTRIWTVNPAASPLQLNEILASNTGAVLHSGTTPDLIELYNTSDVALDISGMRLTPDAAAPDRFVFPPGTTLPARSYMVVYANNPDGTPGLHTGFTISQSGQSIYLFDSVANGGRFLDSITFGSQLPNLSIGRLSDGTWALNMPTFGQANRSTSIGEASLLRINEWLANGSGLFADDFLEIYNPSPLPVDMGGLYLSDEVVGLRNRHRMTPLSFVPGSGYLLLVADGRPNRGADHLNFSLSGDQGAIGLYQADLTPIDVVFYQPQRVNISQGRSPNGGAAIVYFDQPTPGSANPISVITPTGGALVINEVLAQNATLQELGGTPDWVELYNGTTNTVNLGDYSISDSTVTPRRYVFAAGSTIAPGGFLRLLFSDKLPVGTNNAGFGLKGSGGSVFLFDSAGSGSSLLSAVTYGLQTADFSIGRVPDGIGAWVLNSPTPGTPNSALAGLGSPTSLLVNEWMADPASGDDWFEIYNPGNQPIALGGLFLTDDLNNRTKHMIAPLSFIGSGTNSFVLFSADNNAAAGADHVNFSLRAAGEAIGIYNAAGVAMDAITFGQQQLGVSEGRFPDGGTNIVRFPGTASPGASNFRWLAEVVINEVLTHTDEPLEDAIELHNLTGVPIDISGWWLSDDRGTLQKYQIPGGTILPAYGFRVFYETSFTNRELAAIPFALSSTGDDTVLSSTTNGALTGYRTMVKFGGSENGVSFGRYLTSDRREEFVAMSRRSFGVDDPSSTAQFRLGNGASNSYPRVGPVVISEIMYNPPSPGATNDSARDEYIELRNITTAPVSLFDPAFPTNRWRLRDAVDFDFPTGTVMPPGGTVLVVGFDPVNSPAELAGFRNVYGIGNSVTILGPWSGRLANNNESIELRRPDEPNTNSVPYILVERVHYYDSAPWPVEADGLGFSLQRVSDTGFGSDSTNWVAAVPTPGPREASLDSDGDGIPDAWEVLAGLDPFNPSDAVLDSDNDGLTNLQEYLMGTNPRDPRSGLSFRSSTTSGGSNSAVVLRFTAATNVTYAVSYKTSLSASNWITLGLIAGQGPTAPVEIVDAIGTNSQRFYRLALATGREPGSYVRSGAAVTNAVQTLVVSPTGNAVGFMVGPTGRVIVESNTSLSGGTWTFVREVIGTGETKRVVIVDGSAPAGTQRFYRLRFLP